MRDPVKEAMLATTLSGLDEMLERHGFRRTPAWDEEYDEEVRNYWLRDCVWRVDAVDVLYQVRNLRWLLPQVGTYFHLPGMAVKESPFDGTTVDYAIGKHGFSRYYLPSKTMRTFFPNRFARNLIRDTERALAWFDSYDTPQKCLDIFVQEGTNYVSSTTRLGPIVVAYLSDLIGT
jgi:hypothetical protein